MVSVAPRRIGNVLMKGGAMALRIDFLSKPFVAEILLSKVKVFIDLHHHRIKLRELANELNVKSEVLKNEIERRQQTEAALARQAQELARSDADLDSFWSERS